MLLLAPLSAFGGEDTSGINIIEGGSETDTETFSEVESVTATMSTRKRKKNTIARAASIHISGVSLT
jgi:hypothetical protein